MPNLLDQQRHKDPNTKTNTTATPRYVSTMPMLCLIIL
jgi:hypothetical protein